MRSIIALMLTAASATGLAFGYAAYSELAGFFPDAPNALILAVSVIISAAAVLGIEGFIVTTGMQDGIGKTMELVGKSRAWASFLLLAVSVVAALYQRSFLTENVAFQSVSGIVLAFVSAIGVGVAILLAAPYLGVMLSMQQTTNKTWLAEARREFQNVKQRKARSRQRQNPQPNGDQPPASNQQPAQVQISTTDVLRWYMQETGLTLNDDIRAREVTTSYADAHRLTLTQQQVEQMSTAIRTALSRARQRSGITYPARTNGNGSAESHPGSWRSGRPG